MPDSAKFTDWYIHDDIEDYGFTLFHIHIVCISVTSQRRECVKIYVRKVSPKSTAFTSI